jgi:hypothetical protein
MDDLTIRQDVKIEMDSIEHVLNVRSLHVCNAGSRAWGFSHPGSDVDVRFIFAYPTNKYLTLDPPRDMYEALRPPYDIVGWDVRKALGMARKSNPSLIEWMFSPVVYSYDVYFMNTLRSLLTEYHSPHHIYMHLRGIAKSNYAQYIRNPNNKGEAVDRCRYLYAIRPLVNLKWYEDSGGELKCGNFANRIDQVLIPYTVRSIVKEIINIKRQGVLNVGPAYSELDRWIERELVSIEDRTPRDMGESPEFFPKLNSLFLQTLQS